MACENTSRATQSSALSPTTSFPQFRLLPAEIKLEIWRACLPPPRITDVFAVFINTALQERHEASSSCTTNPENSVWIRTYFERLYTSACPVRPALYYVCQQARAVVLETHYSIPNDQYSSQASAFEWELEGVPPQIEDDGRVQVVHKLARGKGEVCALVNIRRDIIFLQVHEQEIIRSSGPMVSSLEVLMRWLGADARSSLRRLALPYYAWRKARLRKSLWLVTQLTALEELLVCFTDADQRRGWLDAVIDEAVTESHIKEARDEVVSDLERLANDFPSWRRPRMSMLQNKKCLKELL
jgi:hypothetical protein